MANVTKKGDQMHSAITPVLLLKACLSLAGGSFTEVADEMNTHSNKSLYNDVAYIYHAACALY